MCRMGFSNSSAELAVKHTRPPHAYAPSYIGTHLGAGVPDLDSIMRSGALGLLAMKSLEAPEA